ncbi:MAG: SBBP repeat-containing protein, partial [Bacteroidales bacterium]|nr:SBBP repeat-containing protein [Bacteroidales bacterium]
YRGVDIGYTQVFRNSLPEEYALPIRCVFSNTPPEPPDNPVPVHGAVDVYPVVNLSWTCSDPDLDPLTYDIYLGPDSIPQLLVSGLRETHFFTEFLATDTTIFWKVIARDIHGAETSSPLWEFRTIPFECGVTTFDYASVTYGTVKYKSRCWIDRNLGASQVATAWDDPASYGYYNQWGRFMDGHQNPTSSTTTTLSNSDDPGHGDFILADPIPHDWRSPQNDSLWQDNRRTNNPCPGGFYVPSETEWTDAITGWASGTSAFNSLLKLSANGYRSRSDGAINLTGSDGYYQASGVSGINHIYFWAGSGAGMYYNGERAGGIAVRCIMENIPPAIPWDPSPPHGSINRVPGDTLKWKCRDGNGDQLMYNIYWGFDPDPPRATNIWNNLYSSALFPYDTVVYWRVEATDFKDTVTSPVWSFRTGEYFGEEFEWVKTPTCEYGNYGQDIASDENGNIYITGYYGGDISFGTDTLTAVGCYDVYIVKMDINGNCLWARSAGGTSCESGHGIAPDNFGNVYVTGAMEGTAFFGSTSLTSYGGKDYFICKLDENGNFLWADHWGESNHDYGFDITTDQAGNAYLTGSFYNYTFWGGYTLDNVIVHKYLPDGWREWMQGFSSDSYDRGYGICTDADGNSYLTGSFNDTIILNNDTLATHGSADIFVAKIDTDGLWQWAVDAGSTNGDYGRSITLDKYGNIYVTGTCWDQAIFGNLTMTGYGSNDIFTAMLDTTGNFKWVTVAGGYASEAGLGIEVDDAGGIFTTGYFGDEGIFGDTTVHSLRTQGLFVAKLNGSGLYEWIKTAENANSVRGNSITVNPEGELFITGTYRDHALFGSQYLFQKGDNAFISKVKNGEMKEISLHAMLQGPYNGTSMNTTLNPADIPFTQPYSGPPWSYNGYEEVMAIPSANIVDWVLVEVRDAASAATATSGTLVTRKAAFIRSDGTITGLDGSGNLFINERINDDMYVVIWHRNHLAVLSAQSVKPTGGVYTFDFSSAASQAYGGVNAHAELSPGVWGLIGGDGNADGQINNGDKNDVWIQQAGTGGYKAGDFNLDIQVNNGDKNDIWIPNTGLGSQVPDFTKASSGKPD